jgi:hypothetical protein
VHHCGKIKSALILLMHGTNMKITKTFVGSVKLSKSQFMDNGQ